ncbi:sensor histidine kinase [Flammeovirga pacifica]|uniref:Signal transduction histidine kinase internal region domain-containing protein n=1 Tax=Flammeovirga pacifica TaxID=915059 RepID=A0A1S1YS11_FLAPC|nr:sensor histidine kinase [Flammeovirga pacifica]OHX63818.1 hypothetical protein NH26_19595 [Flammeovirga pacifica]
MNRWIRSSLFYGVFYPILSGSITYLLLLLAFNRVTELSETIFKAEWIVCILISYLWNTFIIFFSKWMRQRLSVIDSVLEQIVFHAIGAVVGSALVIGLILSIYFYGLFDYSSFSSFSTEMYVFQGLFIFQTLLFECAFWGNHLIKLSNEEARLEEQKRTAFINDEMKAFAEDAHLPFLYETLETIIGLAHKDPDAAEEYAEKLAKVYRNNLQSRKEEFITITQAFALTNEVAELLTISRSGGIHTTFDIHQKDDQLLFPPMLLPRILVAIATDYIASPLQPLSVCFSIKDDQLVMIAHSCNEKIEHDNALGHVINSVQDTLHHYTKIPVQRIQKDNQYLIILPAFKSIDNAWQSKANVNIQPNDQSLFKKS